MSDESNESTVELATELTIAWLNNPNNRVVADEVPTFLRTMHATLAELANGAVAPAVEEVPIAEEFVPAVSVRRSLASKDHIISLIDGKPYKTLTRHLSSNGLTPKEYRARYNLRADYPMVSESYSQSRREMAKRIGLGRRSAAVTAIPEPEAAPAVVAVAPVKKAAVPKAKTAAKPVATKASGPKAAPKPRAKKASAPAASTDVTTETV